MCLYEINMQQSLFIELHACLLEFGKNGKRINPSLIQIDSHYCVNGRTNNNCLLRVAIQQWIFNQRLV